MSNTGNTQQIIDYGATANDGTGDPLRTAFIKTDENFSNIWAAGPVGSNIVIANNTIQNDSTNGNIILKPNGTGVIQANASILPSIDSVRDLGSNTRAWRRAYINIMDTQDLTVSGTLDVAGDAVIQGNLTVEGDTIQIGNITTDTLLIQLANAAANGAQANGAGVTVGANDDIATILYDSANNTWDTNIGLAVNGAITGTSVAVSDATVYGNIAAINGTFTGNVTANYFLGNGSQLTGMATVGGSNTQVQYNNGGIFAGDAGFTYNQANNTISVSGIGTRGEYAAILGASGFTDLNANVVVQMTANCNSYAQVNFQNINSGTRATTDFIATASAGTDSTYYVDMGIASNSYDSANVDNSLGNSLHPQDAYLYSVGGNSYGGTGGNLVVGSNEPGGVVRIIADGSFVSNIVATFSNVGIDVKGNMIPVANGVYSLGNSTNYWSNLWVANNTIYIGGVPLGMTANGVLTVNGNAVLSNDSNTSVSTTGNITANYFIGNGSQLTGLPAPTVSQDITSNGAMSIMLYDGTIKYNNYATVEPSSGNIAGGNISTTGNVTASYFIGNGSQLTGLPEQYGNANVVANLAALSSNPISTTGNISAARITLTGSGTAVNAAAGDILTNQVTGTQFNFLNGLYTAQLNAGQATANYTLQLPANAGTNGQVLTTDGTGALNWSTPASTYGDSNVVTLMSAFGSNTVSTTGNVTAGNFIGSGTNVDIIAGSYDWTFDNAGTLTLPGNTFAVNYANGSAVSLAGDYGNANVVANLAALSSNPVSTTGNVTAGYFIGDGSQLTGLPASYGNANVATFLASYGSNTISTSGNITAGNLIGNISITGNVTGTSANVTLVAGAYSTVFDNIGTATLPGALQLAVYANTTVRDTAIPSPTPGMMIYVTGTGMQVRGATGWNTIAGSGT